MTNYQCCVTRVHFTQTRTRVQFCSLWLGLGLRNCDSWLGPESRPSPSSSGRAVLHCLLWHSIHFVVCFHALEDQKNLCWICGLLDSWLGLEFFFYSDSRTRTGILFDSDSRTRTWTWTLRWWLGLGLRGDDSDLTTWTRTQHCQLQPTGKLELAIPIYQTLLWLPTTSKLGVNSTLNSNNHRPLCLDIMIIIPIKPNWANDW